MQSQEFEIYQVTIEWIPPCTKPLPNIQQWIQKEHNATKVFTHTLSPLEKENEPVLYGSIIHKILVKAANGALDTEYFQSSSMI